MLEYLIETDKQLLCSLNSWGTPEADSLWLVITNELSSIPLYAFLLYLCFKYFHWKRVLLILICGGKYGFFSAHAANTMAIAVFFSYLLRKNTRYIVTLLLCWSIIVSYSRIYLGVHFPGDVLVGWIFGILLATLYYFLFLYTEKRLKIPTRE